MTLAPSHHLALLDQDPQLGDINFLQEHNLGRSVTTNPSAMAVASPQNMPAAMPPWLTGSNHFMSAQTAPYLQSQAPGPSNTWLQGTFEGQEPPQSRAYLRAGSSRSGQSTSSTSSSFGEEAMRNSVPSLVRTPLLQQDAARRGSDDPSNRKRPQSCDICRIRKVKCVIFAGRIPGQGKCRQCEANNVSCTYAYVPKRPGPQTTSAKSIARREERERQAKAAAVAAAARAAGIHDRGKDRASKRFHEGSGSTPPSSNDASRKSSAAASRHASPSSSQTDVRRTAFDAVPLVHHHQTGLHTTRYGSGGNWDQFWAPDATADFWVPNSSSGLGLPSGMTTHDAILNSGSGPSSLYATPSQSACLYSTSRNSSIGQSASGDGAWSGGQPGSSNDTGYLHASMLRPGSPLASTGGWSGCLHEQPPTGTLGPGGAPSFKSSSRASSPRSSLMPLSLQSRPHLAPQPTLQAPMQLQAPLSTAAAPAASSPHFSSATVAGVAARATAPSHAMSELAGAGTQPWQTRPTSHQQSLPRARPGDFQHYTGIGQVPGSTFPHQDHIVESSHTIHGSRHGETTSVEMGVHALHQQQQPSTQAGFAASQGQLSHSLQDWHWPFPNHS